MPAIAVSVCRTGHPHRCDSPRHLSSHTHVVAARGAVGARRIADRGVVGALVVNQRTSAIRFVAVARSVDSQRIDTVSRILVARRVVL